MKHDALKNFDFGEEPPRARAVPAIRPLTRDGAGRFEITEQLVSFVSPDSFVADQYRALRHNIELLRKESGLQMLAVTSPGPGDGKTVTTLNLAGALAQNFDARVLTARRDWATSSGIRDATSVGPCDASTDSIFRSCPPAFR
jgi:Mrp family chromosome partitioning ATPase